jgi:hypothetical protein
VRRSMSIPHFVSIIADITKYVGNSCERLEQVVGLKEIGEVYDLGRKTLEEMVSIVIKSGKGYCIRWFKQHDVDVISIYIAAPEKLYVVRAIRPIRVRRHNYKVFVEEGYYTAEKIAMLEKKYGITTTIDGMPLTPKTASEQKAENETATVDVVE